jgi:hypothetical protein
MPFGTIASAGASQGGIGTTVIEQIYATATGGSNINYGGGFWFGGRDTTVYKSDIKSSWTTSSYLGHNNQNAKPSYWNGYYFLPSGNNDGQWRYSTDISVAPTTVTMSVTTQRVTTMCYFASKYYVFNNNGVYWYSSSIGGSWTSGVSGVTGATYADTDGTTMVVVAQSGQMASTTNGTTWTTRTSSFGTTDINFIKYDPETTYWVASGATGTAAYSANGTTGWTQITHGLGTAAANTINRCNGRFIISQASASATTIRYSKSASSLPTSTFTAEAAITSTGISAASFVLATDGNHVLNSTGKSAVYSR